MANLDHCYNVFDMREVTKRRLPKGIFEYVDKGTQDEIFARGKPGGVSAHQAAHALSQ